MTQQYILDENVFILAQKGENDRGQRDLTCANLFTQINRICHTLNIDPILSEKYIQQLHSLGDSEFHMGPHMLSIFKDALQTEGKVEHWRPSPFPEEESIPEGSTDDTAIVRLAVASGAALVTTDEPLREALNSCGIQEIYDLDIYTPEEALKLL